MTALRGINLGGWLVVERWMTPELFVGSDARDEYGLRADLAGPMQERLLKHRQEFITRQDILDIKRAGFDIVRLPVGFWLWEKIQGYLPDLSIITELLDWCSEAGLGVVLSLHGAPGSQNGWDHSGRVGEIEWPVTENIQDTLKAIDHMALHYGHHDAVLGIAVLNEPHESIEIGTLIKYYAQAVGIIRQKAAPGVKAILSDSFRPVEMIERLHDAGLDDCVLDVHLYQAFDVNDKILTFDQHLHKVETEWRGLLAELGLSMQVMVGEWSAMLASETFAGVSDMTRRGMVKRYYDAQRAVFDNGAWGWAYWSYKTGGSSVWNWSSHDDLRLH